LLAAGRHQELLEVLTLQRFPSWHDRRLGVQALVSQGRMKEALAYAEASRGLNQPGTVVDAVCERIVLDLGRPEEAYETFALTANQSPTRIATFRAIMGKYPGRDPRKIPSDLAASSGESGRWFAAAKDPGFRDLAFQFARSDHTDPRTLCRASGALAGKGARFSLEASRLAVRRAVEGYGYELTTADLMDDHRHLMAATPILGVTSQVRAIVLAGTAERPGGFSDLLIRHFTADSHGNRDARKYSEEQGDEHGQFQRGTPQRDDR
jgi:hypothetical protein